MTWVNSGGVVTGGGVSSSPFAAASDVAQLQSHTSGYINVQEAPYSAKGDGVTDDTAAIQAALTEAASRSRTGGTVYLPLGDYKINSTLNLAPVGQQTRILLIGEALDGTQLSWYGGNSTAINIPGRTRGLRIANIRLENKGSVGTSVGIQFGGDTSGTNHSAGVLEQVRVLGFFEGIAIGDNSSHGASEMEFRQVVLDNNTTGVVIRDTQTADIWFYGLSLNGNGTGLKAINAANLHIVGGSASSSSVQDFEMQAGAAEWTIDHFRSENANRFLSVGDSSAGGQTTGTFAIRNSVIGATTAADNRAVRLFQGGQYIIENNRFIDGHVYLQTGTGGVAARTTMFMHGNHCADGTLIENGDVIQAFTIVYSFGNKSDTTVFMDDRIFYWRDSGTLKEYWKRGSTNGETDITETGINYIEGGEISDPAAPSANRGRLYFRDNGSGKTQIVARFPTGAVQVIATEP